ncbi:hypothetical protein [Rhodococcus sp. 06-462-5]|uniref:MmyB family transcriptional regulator n=1 Tax=unclassified Rhodococcus (in: high G+C Gram-positive bacteria) TaxID=192944 RepID=UPI0015C617DB
MEAAQAPSDSRSAALVGELSLQDKDFRGWWASQFSRPAGRSFSAIRAREFTLEWEMLTCATDPDQQLMVMTANPGTATHQTLRILAVDRHTAHARADHDRA